jgi:hypothetical protein
MFRTFIVLVLLVTATVYLAGTYSEEIGNYVWDDSQ